MGIFLLLVSTWSDSAVSTQLKSLYAIREAEAIRCGLPGPAPTPSLCVNPELAGLPLQADVDAFLAGVDYVEDHL